MNLAIEQLNPYPFEKLRQLFQTVQANAELSNIALSIGEPKHPAPGFVQTILQQETQRLANYPNTKGLLALRETISKWLQIRFKLHQLPNPETQILPVNGTREALFSFAQAVVNRESRGSVLMPNPFYQIYEGAAILAGAEPIYLHCDKSTGFLPDFFSVSAEQWQRCQLLYICTPGNPTGTVIPKATLRYLIDRAQEYNFVIASDECYSEIYSNTAPTGLLEICSEMGNSDYEHCVVFHSLSKRSNLPGLRSGFVAGDASVLSQFLTYRTYHGCAMPIHHQLASIAAWDDEEHVQINRKLYTEKFDAVLSILGSVLSISQPEAGFYLWPETPVPDDQFAQQLFEQQNVTVLPGRFLGRQINDINPGANHIRMALVAPLDDCIEASQRIKYQINQL